MISKTALITLNWLDYWKCVIILFRSDLIISNVQVCNKKEHHNSKNLLSLKRIEESIYLTSLGVVRELLPKSCQNFRWVKFQNSKKKDLLTDFSLRHCATTSALPRRTKAVKESSNKNANAQQLLLASPILRALTINFFPPHGRFSGLKWFCAAGVSRWSQIRGSDKWMENSRKY